MQTDLQQSLTDILESEGGWTLSQSEPGGASNWGISMITWTDYCKKNKLPVPTLDDLKAVTLNQASLFYQNIWADHIDFAELPVGVDYRLLDLTVNLGLHGGIMLLQQVLGLPQTGIMDAPTIAKVKTYNARDSQTLVLQLGDAWIEKKKTAPNWTKYQLGWTIRAQRTNIQAIDMITGAK